MKVCHGWIICRTCFAGCFSNSVCYWRPYVRNKSVGLGHFVRFVVKFFSKRYPNFCVCFWHNSHQWARASSFTRFLDHTKRRSTVGRAPLDEWSARRRDLYLTTHNTHNIQTSMPPVGFEPTVLAGERPRTYALDRASTGTCYPNLCVVLFLYTDLG